MISFSLLDVVGAVVFGSVVGLFVLGGANAQYKRDNASALATLHQHMGSLYTAMMFAAGALPLAVVYLIAVLDRMPTIGDTILLIVLIGVAMIANFTLYGNAMRLLGDRLRDGPGGTR